MDLLYISLNGWDTQSGIRENRQGGIGDKPPKLGRVYPSAPVPPFVFLGIEMPKIRHWHNVSHDFNRDPEVRELRRRFGDWMALVWLEMLSIADRNDGKVPGELSLIAESLSHVSLTKYRGTAVKTIRIAFEFMLNCGWIVVENASNLSQKPVENASNLSQKPEEKAMIRIVNYVKYKNTRDANKNPTGNATAPLLTYPNQPNLPKEEDKIKTAIAPKKGATLEGFDLFWKEYPKKRGKGPAERAWLKIAPNNGLYETIISAITKQKAWPDWVKDQGQFIPYPASWLNQKRWEDEIEEQKEERTGVWAKKFTPEPK